jgi:putative ABC transport system permease protein
MNLAAATRLALDSLRAHKLRSVLTMLGIIIGVLSVVTIVSIGEGAKRQIDDQVKALGSNIIILSTGFGQRGPVRTQGSGTPITERDAAAIAGQVSGVRVAVPVRQGSAQIVADGANWSTSVMGTTADILVARDWATKTGRVFTASEERGGAKVAVLGQTVVKELFGGADPIGRTIRAKGIPLRVIGTLTPKGQNMLGQDQDDIVVVPLKTAQSRVLGGGDRAPGEVNQIIIKAVSEAALSGVQRDADALMRERQRIGPDEPAGFNLRNLSEIMQLQSGTASVMTALLSAIASVALVVGGIGIMNIMLVSVTERTREIGLRMAVGARPGDVLLQFLTEAATLSFVGGIIGVVLAIPICFAFAAFAGWEVAIPVEMVFVALIFSGGIGVIFGYYPARRASKLSPIEALRYD